MARKPVLEGGKKDEIIETALKLFLEKGYDGTSIRMILNQVNGEVGMFYHYFNSKQEVFDRAFEQFMKKQSNSFSLLMSQESENITPRIRLEQLGICYQRAMKSYEKLSNGMIHWSVLSSLHEAALKAMLPSFKTMLAETLDYAGKNDISEAELLAPFILKGISGLLHEKSFMALPDAKQMTLIIDYMSRMLQVPHNIFDK